MLVWSDLKTNHHSVPEAGVVVNVPSKAWLLEDVEQHLMQRKGFAVATLNLDHVVKINAMSDFNKAYAAHSHVTADGNPIVWLSRYAGHSVELTPGSELIDPLVSLAARQGNKVAFFGATQDTLDKAAAVLKSRYPDLKVVQKIAPLMGFDPTGPAAHAAIEELKDAEVDLCFLALGAPKQELFASHALKQLPSTGFVSIGAGLDFIAGNQVRAPRLVRKLALEWAWRLLNDPARLARRYGACLAILPRLIAIAHRSRVRS